MISYYQKKLRDKGELYLLCKVFPGSDITAFKNLELANISGRETEVLSVKIKAPADKGKANKDLLKFLKKEFGAEAKIISGSSDRLKLVKLKF